MESFVPTATFIGPPGAFPLIFEEDAMVWDPRPGQPFIYVTPAYTGAGEENSLSKVGRATLAPVLIRLIGSPLGTFGVADIDTAGRLYWATEQNWGNSTQTIGRWSGDTLGLLQSATQADSTALYEARLGTFRVDRRSSVQLWWHLAVTDLYHGDITGLSQATMKVVYFVPRTAFGLEGGFASGPRHIVDMDPDASGVLWVFQTNLSAPGGEYRLWKVTPAGVVTLEWDCSTAVQGLAPGAAGMAIKWIAADNTLLLSVPPYLFKYSLASRTLVGTLDTGVANLEQQQSFHHTADDAFPVIWLGQQVLDTAHAADSTRSPYFPRFWRVDPVALTVDAGVTVYATGALYDTYDINSFLPRGMLYDRTTNCVFVQDAHQAPNIIGHFCFGMAAPVVRSIIPLCPPIGVTLATTHTKRVLFPTESL